MTRALLLLMSILSAPIAFGLLTWIVFNDQVIP